MKLFTVISTKRCSNIVILLLGCLVVALTGCSSSDNGYIAQQYQGSVLVYQQGLTLFSGGFGYANQAVSKVNSADTSFRIGSISKQFTSMAIMILEERGMLSVDDLVSKHLLDYPNGNRITIQQLLNHTSGTPNYTEFDFYPSVVEQAHSISDVLDYFKSEPLEFEPGTKFSYSNSGYVVLGAIIEAVSNRSYTEFLHEEIFERLDMSQSGYLDLEEKHIELAKGYLSDYKRSPYIHPTLPSADGGLASSVNDLLKWHKALQDNVLINQQTKQSMFTPWLNNVASGWFVGNYFSSPVYYHGGGYSGFRAGIYHYPVQDRLIVLLSNSEETDINSIARRIDELIR